MNKKFVLLMSLMILVGVAGIALADYDNVAPPNGQGSVVLEKGWNLVSLYSIDKVFDLAFSEDSSSYAQYNQEINSQGIRAVFIYDRSSNDYIRLYPNPERDKFISFVNKVDTEQGASVTDGGGYVNSAVWVYSDKVQTIQFSTIDGPFYLKYVGLKTGWNFLAITPELKGMPYNDFKGTCDIIKICDYQRNNWQCINGANLGTNKVADTDYDLWKGRIIKVSSNCVLGSSISNFPSLPN